MTRLAARVDGNHAAVVQALRDFGMRVLSLAPMGKGCADLLVGYRDQLFMLELKDGSLPPSARKLTVQELEFVATWPQTYVVTSPQEAIETVVNAARPTAPGPKGGAA
jgi:hypothetical protein